MTQPPAPPPAAALRVAPLPASMTAQTRQRQETLAFASAVLLTVAIVILALMYLATATAWWLDAQKRTGVVATAETGAKLQSSVALLRGIAAISDKRNRSARIISGDPGAIPSGVALDWRSQLPALLTQIQTVQSSNSGSFIALTQVVSRDPPLLVSVPAAPNQPIIVDRQPSAAGARLYEELRQSAPADALSRSETTQWQFPPVEDSASEPARNLITWPSVISGEPVYAINDVNLGQLFKRRPPTGQYLLIRAGRIVAASDPHRAAQLSDLPAVGEEMYLSPRYPAFGTTFVVFPVGGLGFQVVLAISLTESLQGMAASLIGTLGVLGAMIGGIWWMHGYAVRRWLRPIVQMQSELLDTSRELETLIAVCPVGIVLIDRRKRQVVRVNDATRQILPALTPGVDMPDFLVRHQWRGTDTLSDAIQTMHDGDSRAVRLRSFGGAERTLDVLVHALAVARGELLMCAIIDLSEERAARAEAEAARAETSRANASLKAFVATIGHEIRTPLSTIISAAEMLRNGDHPRAAQDLPRTIAASADILLRTVNDVLDYSKIDAGMMDVRPSQGRLAELFERMEFLYRDRAQERRLALNFYVAAAVDAPFATDWVRLQQVIGNLLDNALKFTHYGRISVIARRSEQGQVWIDVADTGVGIERDQQARVGEPFVQVGEGAHTSGGTGLGVAVSRRICRLLGGDLSFTSEAGIGTRFRVELPGAVPPPTLAVRHETPPVVFGFGPPEFEFVVTDLCQRAGIDFLAGKQFERFRGLARGFWRAEVVQPVAPDGSAQPYGLRLSKEPRSADAPAELWLSLGDWRALASGVSQALTAAEARPDPRPACLLVDDDAVGGQVLSARLEAVGVRVEYAASVAEARLKIDTQLAAFTFVISDFNLPDGDGLKVLSHLRDATPAGQAPIPVVCLSAGIAPSLLDAASRAGFAAMLQKPVESATLNELVKRYAGVTPRGDPPSAIDPRLGRLFHDQTVRDLRMIRALVRRGRLAAAGRLCHRITGAAAMLGLPDAMARARGWQDLLANPGLDLRMADRLFHIHALCSDAELNLEPDPA